jgi:hypothetical protein
MPIFNEPQIDSGAKAFVRYFSDWIFGTIPQLSVGLCGFQWKKHVAQERPMAVDSECKFTRVLPALHSLASTELGRIAFPRAYQDRVRVYDMTLQQSSLRCEA